MAGLFSFGKKKEEEKMQSIDQEIRKYVRRIMSSHGEGLYQILARASPDGNVEKIREILGHKESYNGPQATKEAKYRDIYVETKDMQHELAAAHYPVVHAFLALAMAYHTGVHSLAAARAIEDVLTAAYQTKADYSELKKRKEILAKAIAKKAKERGITTDEEKTAKIMEEAFDKAFKIIDKIAPDYKKESLAILSRTIAATTDDPFVVLRNAGIDIEPELEEFRQFLVEISGKKIKAEKPAPSGTKGRLSASDAFTRARLEILSIVNGLEFAGFTEEAKKKALERLSSRVAELAGEEPSKVDFALLGLYAYALEAVKRGELEKLKKILE